MARAVTEILIDRGKLDRGALQRASNVSTASGEPIHRVLPRLGLVSEDDVARALAESLGLGLAGAQDFPPRPVLAERVAVGFLRQSRLVPVAETPAEIAVAMADPLDSQAVEALRLIVDKPLRRLVATPAEIDRQLDRLYGDAKLAEVERIRAAQPGPRAVDGADVQRLRDLASGAPVIRLVNRLIAQAVDARASDIHIEPFEGALRVRQRIDGMLRPVDAPPSELHAALVSRVKIMAGLDIVERRLPQDGRCRTTVEGRDIDLRVSVVPTIHGEGVVLRILDRARAPLDLARLGFAPAVRERIERTLSHANGILLATGPTGSGKTTTLYAALQRLNEVGRKIVTVEDPVEYHLTGISQIQVNPRIGLGFATVLRSVLRHDPDVIMVGEIRDVETARIAVQAALTGHVVLSTLHTNNAAAAVARLADMGIEGYLITSAVRGILAQRLVRALCPRCRAPHPDAGKLLAAMGAVGEAHTVLYRAAGCEACGGTGYLGRTSVGEMLLMSDGVRRLVLDGADAAAIERQARTEGMRSLREDGLAKALAGETTLDEVLRVTQAE